MTEVINVIYHLPSVPGVNVHVAPMKDENNQNCPVNESSVCPRDIMSTHLTSFLIGVKAVGTQTGLELKDNQQRLVFLTKPQV